MKPPSHYSEEERRIYIEGLKGGVRMYAWWKDGIQYVGTCGVTLKSALERIDRENEEE